MTVSNNIRGVLPKYTTREYFSLGRERFSDRLVTVHVDWRVVLFVHYALH